MGIPQRILERILARILAKWRRIEQMKKQYTMVLPHTMTRGRIELPLPP